MKRLNFLGSRGDTIVEVMIVLAVLSLALSISSATANTSLQKSRNAEEHSESTGIINAQIEQVRAAVKAHVALPTSGVFCMTSPTAFNSSFPVGYTVPDDPKNDQLEPTDGTYPAACVKDYYHISVVLDADGTYRVRVRWPGIASLGDQQVETNYRTHELQPDVSTIPITGGASSITVRVDALAPSGSDPTVDRTPSCTSTSTVGKDNIPVTLHGGVLGTQTVDTVSSVSFFSNVQEGYNYYATIPDPPLVKYKVCPTNPSVTKHLNVGASMEIDMKVYPDCSAPITVTDPDTPIYGPDTTNHDGDYNTGGDPIYGPTYYVKGIRAGQPGYPPVPPAPTDGRNIFLTDDVYTNASGFYYEKDASRGNSGGWWYNLWTSQATADVIGHTPIVTHHEHDYQVQGPIIGYEHHSHTEYPCPS